MPNTSAPKDWDFAAPAKIKAAGEQYDLDNKDLCYGKSNFEQGGIIVASNNITTHKELCLSIKEIIEKYKIYPF